MLGSNAITPAQCVPIWSRQVTPTSDARTFYDEVYYEEAEKKPSYTRHYQQLARRLGIGTSDAVVDIACGTGEWLGVVHDIGAKVAGIDLSERAINVARRSLPDADLRASGATELPWGDDVFDLVTCLGSLEHFPDQAASLREIKRIAKPGGRVLILVPNAGFLTRRLRLFRGTEQRDIREVVLPIAEWEAMFEAADMKVVDRWKDLHILSASWIKSGPVVMWPLRTLQALALTVWPLSWQYQVYFLCRV